MNATLPHLIRQTISTRGCSVPRESMVQTDHFVDTFRVGFNPATAKTLDDIKNVIQGFHEVVESHEKIKNELFIFQIRSLSGVSADSLENILRPFWSNITVQHVHKLTVVRIGQDMIH